MVAIQLKFLNLVALCTLVSSSAIYTVQQANSPGLRSLDPPCNNTPASITEEIIHRSVNGSDILGSGNAPPADVNVFVHPANNSNRDVPAPSSLEDITNITKSITHRSFEETTLPIPIQGPHNNGSEVGQKATTGGQTKRAGMDGVHLQLQAPNTGSSNGRRTLGAVRRGLD